MASGFQRGNDSKARQSPGIAPITGARVEEIAPAQETHQDRADAPQQDNGIPKPATNDAQLGPESSQQTSPTHNNEAKKDIVE